MASDKNQRISRQDISETENGKMLEKQPDFGFSLVGLIKGRGENSVFKEGWYTTIKISKNF